MQGIYLSAIKSSCSLRTIVVYFRLSVSLFCVLVLCVCMIAFLYFAGLYFCILHLVFALWCNGGESGDHPAARSVLLTLLVFLSLCNIFVYFSLSLFLYFACLYFCVCKIAFLYFAGLYFCILHLVFALWCNGGESGDHPAAPSVLLTLFFSQSEAGRGAI